MTQRLVAAILIILIYAEARANTANFNTLTAGTSYAAPALFSNGGLDFDVLSGPGNLNVSAASGLVNPSFAGNYLKLTTSTTVNVNLPTGASQIQFDFIRNNPAAALVVNGSWLDFNLIPSNVNGVSVTNALPAGGNWGSVSATGNINSFIILGSDFLVDNLNATLNPGLAGDLNKNHVVDAGDYTLWRKTLNTPSGFKSWRANFSASDVGAGTSVSVANIPEPSTMALVLFGLQRIATQRRPRRAPHSAR